LISIIVCTIITILLAEKLLYRLLNGITCPKSKRKVQSLWSFVGNCFFQLFFLFSRQRTAAAIWSTTFFMAIAFLPSRRYDLYHLQR